MPADVETTDEGPPQPAKRTSVVDMWRQKEQAMLAKQGALKVTSSPVRRSFKFEEKKFDAVNDSNSKTEVVPAPKSTVVSQSRLNNGVNTWKKQGSLKTYQPSSNSNFGDARSKFGGTTNAAATNATTREVQAVPKVDSNEGSTSERTHFAKNKFAMMGQKHAARPKKLPNFSSYQQQATSTETDPLSPESMNSAALSAAFDDVFPEEQEEKPSAELSHNSRWPQSEGLQNTFLSMQSSAARPSEYSSLQVSDSASIPNDVHGAQRRYYEENDKKDDDSMISGLSSPGSPARSIRQRRQNRMSGLESPQEEPTDGSVEISMGDGQDVSFDSEGFSVGFSTVTSAMTGANNNSPQRSQPKSGLDKVSEAVITDGFVAESDTNVSAFQSAVQKMSLADFANDISDEAKAVFGNMNMDKISNDFNQSMATAQETFNRLVQGSNNVAVVAPGQKKAAMKEAVTDDVEPTAALHRDGAEASGRVKPTDQSDTERPVTAQTETEVASETLPEQPEPEKEAQPEESMPMAEPPSESAAYPETEETAEFIATFPALEVATAPVVGQVAEPPPTPPAVKKELAEETAEFIATFPALEVATAPVVGQVAEPPLTPPAAKKELALPKKEAPPVLEEVAIEVEYLEDSDDDEGDV